MNHLVATYKGESFFQKDLLIFVNRATEDFTAPLHNHDFLEIAFVAEGSGFHHIGDSVRRVSKGDLFIIPIGVPHVFRPSAADAIKHPLAVYNCVFSPRLLERIDPLITDSKIAEFICSLHQGEPQSYSLNDSGDTLDKLFLSLHREFALPRQGSSDYLHTLLLQLLITIYRLTENDLNRATSHSIPFIHLLQFLDQHIEQEITLAHMAQISGYSERHLQRLFKLLTGQTLSRYKQNRRIEKSCELLKSTQLKISTIAEKVGYKDVDSFTAIFKRCMGRTPSAYRLTKPITDIDHHK